MSIYQLLQINVLPFFVLLGCALGLLVAVIAGESLQSRMALRLFPWLGGAAGMLTHLIGLIVKGATIESVASNLYRGPGNQIHNVVILYFFLILILVIIMGYNFWRMYDFLATGGRNPTSMHKLGFYLPSSVAYRRWVHQVWAMIMIFAVLLLPSAIFYAQYIYSLRNILDVLRIVLMIPSIAVALLAAILVVFRLSWR